jgi:simple sugar transport system ATP-binding protein
VDGVSKQFPGVKALSKVSFRMFKGEVHALMGQNGAGKSTLIKVLTGVYPTDSGTMLLCGKPIAPLSTHDAQLLGISTVYQEVNLCLNLSIAENIFIGREPRKFGAIDWKAMKKGASLLLKNRLNLDIDVSEPLSSYSIAIQQMVSIARAINIDAKVLILDEPTSSLDENEVKQLFDIMRKLKNEGMSILFVTHFLEQVYSISDRITVLKNGELVGEYPTEDLPPMKLISAMIGKEYKAADYAKSKAASAEQSTSRQTILNVRNLERKGSINEMGFSLKKGEILGLAGLLGSGRTETVRLLFGIDKADKGHLELNGKPVHINSPMAAIENGFGFCPEDRKIEGLIGDLTVRENIILALQGRTGTLKTIPRSKQVEIANKYIKALGIKVTDCEQIVSKLSGGNQQKVILARWLATSPAVMILDEPTRGIDIGAKSEIIDLILDLCQEGMSFIFISSELEEVVKCCSRVVVLCDRKKIGELEGDDISEAKILHLIAEGNN